MHTQSALLSLLATTVLAAPAFAHPTQTRTTTHRPLPVESLILCDDENNLLDLGGFGRFVHSPRGGLIASVGGTDSQEPGDTIEGVRVDASGYPANSWSFDTTVPNGQDLESLVFTSIQTQDGFFYQIAGNTGSGNKRHFSYPNTLPPGQKFVSVYAYFFSVAPQWQVNISNFLIDGVTPQANTHNFQDDCTIEVFEGTG
jgi:hypothetical protein